MVRYICDNCGKNKESKTYHKFYFLCKECMDIYKQKDRETGDSR